MAASSAGLRAYYRLTKPGIIYGNLVTGAAGFLLASRHLFHFWLMIEALGGLSLVIASACVFNNYIDRGIDRKMKRTQRRALATEQISGRAALVYASVLGILGFLILGIFTNWLALGLSAAGLISYVLIYGAAKRRTIYSTLIGSLPGAVPPAIGYLAVTNQLDSAVVILFLILVLWQMPHFYAIAMYRYEDYKAAGLPVLPVIKGRPAAKRQIMAYIAGFTVMSVMLSVFGYTGYIYLSAVLILGFYWLRIGFKSYKLLDDERWGRQIFLASLVVNLGLSLAIAFGGRLP